MKIRMFGNGLLLDYKALQRDVEVSRCQAETPKYVGYICLWSYLHLGVLDCKYIHLYWHLFVRLSALAVWSHYIYNIFGSGPCSSSDVMTSPPLNRCDCREMRAESPSETTTRRIGTWWPNKWRRESWTSSSSQRWNVLGFPSTAMPLDVWKKTRTCRNHVLSAVSSAAAM